MAEVHESNRIVTKIRGSKSYFLWIFFLKFPETLDNNNTWPMLN